MAASPLNYDPVVLFAKTTVSANSGSSPNSSALKNPHNLPMELLAIRVGFYPNPSAQDIAAGFPLASNINGLAIGMKLDLGNIPIMNAAVPVSCIGNIFDTVSGSLNSLQHTFYAANRLSAAGETSYEGVNQWRLRYPLYIPPGSTVVPTFQNLGQISVPINIEIIYFCRSLPASYVPPPEIMVPWVTSFKSKSFEYNTDTPSDSDESSENDLANVFDVDLEIARFTGATIFSDGSNVSADPLLPAIDYKLRIVTSRGDNIVRTPTLFDSLFPSDWLVWDMPSNAVKLSPKDYVKVFVTVDPQISTITDPGDAANRSQLAIVMEGYRKIKTKPYAAAIGAAQ